MRGETVETARRVIASILWRRLDTAGHDACRLEGDEGGWQLDGAAVFQHDGVPAHLAYQVRCDRAWRTREGRVQGWVGSRAVDVRIVHTDEGSWSLNDRVMPGLEACVDLDLGFTPATNLLSLRRLALAEGKGADVPVAWLDEAADTLELLPQHYERRTATTYWYESRTAGYSALLETTPAGFVSRYPSLWEMDAYSASSS
jgi:hypothetical protein